MTTKTQDNFLLLVRLGIGHMANGLLERVDWPQIKALAESHGLFAVILDGIEVLRNQCVNNVHLPSQEMMLQWIGEMLQNYEGRYTAYESAIGELARFYNQRGLKMMILKGYACGVNWPKPNHRPYGDIDIWQFGKQKEADAFISEKGIMIDTSLPHHTVFCWGDFVIENHFHFLNIFYGHRNSEMEVLLKEKAKDDSYSINVKGEKVYLPNPDLHALFLLRHSMLNFAATGITIRQVLDWAFFVEKYTQAIDWQWLLRVLKEYKMMDFFNYLNAICVDNLGFSSGLFPSVQFLPDMKERVLADILSPEFSGETPRNILMRIIFKYRRWRANAWKQEFCYEDNRLRSFVEGVQGHLLKPSTI